MLSSYFIGNPSLQNKSQIPSNDRGRVNIIKVITLLLFSNNTAKVGIKQIRNNEKTNLILFYI